MADIARRARVSTGNLYRYFPDKQALFDAVLPATFVDRLVGLLRQRVASLAGVGDVRRLGTGSAFHLVSEELLSFCLANRLRVVVLLRGPKGTEYEAFPARLLTVMKRLAVRHFRRLGVEVPETPAFRFALEQIYRNWLSALTEILATGDERAVRDRLDRFSSYHLAGMNGLFRVRN
jgi:AcrR family transcriptional regulator